MYWRSGSLPEFQSWIAVSFHLSGVHRVVGDCLNFRNMIPSGNKRRFIKLENTISHSILDASSTGSRNTSPWDMAVAFNPADSSIGSRQLLSELDYLYKYDPKRHAYVGRDPGAEAGSVLGENRPFLIILQSENDKATGTFFPIGTGLFNVVNLRTHWDRVPIPGSKGKKCLKANSMTIRPATISTWSTITSFRSGEPLLQRV
jgi:hypothetical protein